MFDKDFFRDKNVLITGHTGFKGTWLSIMLETLGAQLHGFALPDSDKTEFFADSHISFRSCRYGMMQNYDDISECISSIAPDIIIHLASHSTLDKNGELTSYIFDSNVKGAVNLYEAVRKCGHRPKAILTVTSDKCYLNAESNVGYTEGSPLGAQDPYSTSKACQELISDCYRKSFFTADKLNVPLATARASNVIGGGDNNLSRLFPYLLDCFANGRTAQIRNPEAIRPWQNVLDVLGGYLTLVEKIYGSDPSGRFASAFNFGPEEDGFAPVKDIADFLSAEFGNAPYEITGQSVQVRETNVLKLDSSKAKSLLDWKPRYSFRDTLKMTAEFKRNVIRSDHGTAAREMIERYLETV